MPSFISSRLSILFGLLILLNRSVFVSAQMPEVHESGLTLTLFAEDPDIVTPVGMVVGDDDKIYVIESHTHNRPNNYKGPTGDVIKVFVDEDKDGVADSNFVFAEGFEAAMNLAFSKDGTLYVLCAWSLYALPDRDGDGVCDGPELILELETKAGNPHGCWLGITFDDENRLFISRGNVGGEYYRIQGKDGSVVEGYGDGGNVVRARADGTELQEWATGFWNSMDLKFDHKGNLLLIDNDPDARGPNRLVRIVEGGDYGHKHMFGGDGRHPFQGWDGSFPGHLPILSGTGEAPSGLIDVSPRGKHSVLVSVWNEHTIERHDILKNNQVEKSIFMSGGKNFRPVALDQDSAGNLFISDWMLVDYPNHGKGRIWRVSKLPIPKQEKVVRQVAPTRKSIHSVFKNADPFVRQRGELWLSKPEQKSLAIQLSGDSDPLVRLGAFLALRRTKTADHHLIRNALADPDMDVRLLALMWAGETLEVSLRPALDEVLVAGEVTARLFNTYLAAVEMVNETFIEAFKKKAYSSKKVPRELEPRLLLKLALNPRLSSLVRAEAVKRLKEEEAVEFLFSNEEAVLRAAIEKVASVAIPQVGKRFREIALDSNQASEVRAEALLGLSKQVIEEPSSLLPLLKDADSSVAYEAARTLRYYAGTASVRAAFGELEQTNSKDKYLKELVAVVLHGLSMDQRPKTLEEWKKAAVSGGDPSRGDRVFRTTQSMCTRCHAVDGGGTNLGPDLGGIAQSVTPAQIAHSILRPSDSFPPQYQAWNIYTTDGKIHSGIQIDHQNHGAMLLYTTENINRRFEAKEVKNYEASPYSLMPQGLENTMTVSEFKDLVAYLSSLK
ncbi:MAG: c-type cytochrome [Verrucomicrobia bacterium]|nr:c-type cytochrome [Verrucomicrobiota bacterium]MDA1066083.1 c-type cytochrome [Verrucomicrobiota bacterium]